MLRGTAMTVCSGVRRLAALGALSIAMGLLLGACASGGDSGTPVESCEDKFDCPIKDEKGRTIECRDGKCLPVTDSTNNGGADTGIDDTGGDRSDGDDETGETDSDDDGGGSQFDPDDCEGNCGPAEECVNGSCVSRQQECSPECAQGKVCDTSNGECVPISCDEKGDSCDVNQLDQGTFWCVQLSQSGDGTCVPKCDNEFAAGSCADGEYCRNLRPNGEPALACLPSQCSTNADCTTSTTQGTCINFDNHYGICFAPGPLAPGEQCSTTQGSDLCQRGYWCRTPQGSDSGVCAKLCDPWATSSSSCPSGEACTVLTNRQGICSDKTEATPKAPYASCSTSGNMCSDGTVCLGSSSPNCYKFCRTGEGDCDGLTFNGEPLPSTCDNYMVPGERSYGLCFPTCQTAADCCPDSNPDCGLSCHSGICRTTCSPASVAEDCCNGDTPCDFRCVGGLCE